VLIFGFMKPITDEPIPDIKECSGNLKNVIDALYVLNGKWKLAVILSLVHSSKRFNEIQQELGSISPKVLAKELKDLELNEFIERKVFPTTPVTIIYEATAYSNTLESVLSELSVWGANHRERVKESMRKHL
jgi:DNA-binding HxlR family transcriptional regulator